MRKGRCKRLYLGHRGGLGTSIAQGCRRKVLPKEDSLATIPLAPQYLAHATPHGFSLPRIRIQMASRYPKRLSANKHPKNPRQTVRSAPAPTGHPSAKGRTKGETRVKRGACRAPTNSAHLPAAGCSHGSLPLCWRARGTEECGWEG